MELKLVMRRVVKRLSAAFNRTAYGIEIQEQGSYRYGVWPFNRTAYGIEIWVLRSRRVTGMSF